MKSKLAARLVSGPYSDPSKARKKQISKPKSAKMLLEVRAIDGSVRSFELVDAETRSNEALLADWRAQVCDKIGLLPCEEPTAPRASLPSTALEDIFGGDVADNILLRLGSLSLARLGGASRLLWHRCGRNALWVVHHHSQFCRSGGAFGRNWNPFRGEISDVSSLPRLLLALSPPFRAYVF